MDGVIKRLSRGLSTHRRSDGSVIRLHAGGRLIGEIVIGETTMRVNFKEEFTPEVELVAQAEGVITSGRSKQWDGGGLRVTDENANSVKAVLDAVADEAAKTARRSQSLRTSLATLEEAARDGHLDEALEDELRKLLERQPLRPTTRRGRKRNARRGVATVA